MDLGKYDELIRSVNLRVSRVTERLMETRVPGRDRLADTFETLCAALEELQVAGEEIRRQRDALAGLNRQDEIDHYRNLFVWAPDGYLVTDRAGTIRDANQAALGLLNSPKQFAVGRPLVTYLPKEERSGFRTRLVDLGKADRPDEFTVCLRARKSAIRVVSLTVGAQPSADGAESPLLWRLRDVTEPTTRAGDEWTRRERTARMEGILEAAIMTVEILRDRLDGPLDETASALEALDRTLGPQVTDRSGFDRVRDAIDEVSRRLTSAAVEAVTAPMAKRLGGAFPDSELLRSILASGGPIDLAAATAELVEASAAAATAGRTPVDGPPPVPGRAEEVSAGEGDDAVEGRARLLVETLRAVYIPDLPQVPGLAIGQLYLPYQAEPALMGGDFIDLFPLGEDRYGLMIGDVSGKGVEAAVTAAMAKYMLRTLAAEFLPPAVIVQKADRMLVDQLGVEQFLTLFFGVLDLREKRVCYVNAGHEPVLLERATGDLELLADGGPVLGASRGNVFVERTVSLRPADSLILYTDGLSEARRGDQFLGWQGIGELLAGTRGQPPQLRVQSLMEIGQLFNHGMFHDDVAVVILRVDGAGPEVTPSSPPGPDPLRFAHSPAFSHKGRRGERLPDVVP